MGKAIADAIVARGRSIPAVARAVGHDPSWLNRVVNGEIRIKAHDLEKIEELLDVQLSATDALREIAGSDLSGTARIAVVDQEASASLRGGIVVDYVSFPASAMNPGDDQHVVALRVRGDCLSPDIVDGDYVIVDTTKTAESGNPVVAIIEGTLHVKRYRVRANGRTVLSSNEGEIPIEPRQIEGVVIGLWRQLGRLADMR